MMRPRTVRPSGFCGVVVDPETGLWSRAWVSPFGDGLYARADIETTPGATLLVRAPCPDGTEMSLSCIVVAVRRDPTQEHTGIILRLHAATNRDRDRLRGMNRMTLTPSARQSPPPSAAE